MLQPVIISEEQVLEVLNWPLVTAAVEVAMKAVTKRQRSDSSDVESSFAVQPARTILRASKESQVLLTMPCFVGDYRLRQRWSKSTANTNDDNKDDDNGDDVISKRSTLACKVVTSFGGNERRQPALPNIMANILLFSGETGQLQSIIAGTHITAWRTAAASIVATKYLYFARKCDRADVTVAIIGCGVQGRAHALAMCHSFAVATIYLWNRTTSKAEALAKELLSGAEEVQRMQVHVAATSADAVAKADIICTCTYAAEPLVTLDMLQNTDVHINAIGAGQVHFGEVASDIYAKAHIYTDSWTSAKIELKDLPGEIIGEVGEVILEKTYPAADTLTIFQSLGMASEDATVGQAVFDAIKDKSNPTS